MFSPTTQIPLTMTYRGRTVVVSRLESSDAINPLKTEQSTPFDNAAPSLEEADAFILAQYLRGRAVACFRPAHADGNTIIVDPNVVSLPAEYDLSDPRWVIVAHDHMGDEALNQLAAQFTAYLNGDCWRIGSYWIDPATTMVCYGFDNTMREVVRRLDPDSHTVLDGS